MRSFSGCDFIPRDTAIDERDHPNGVRHDTRIVGREDERHAMSVPKVAHHVHEDFGVLSIEIRRRLVGEDEGGACGDGPCHRDPLLLTT
jgi:hypothetical protein